MAASVVITPKQRGADDAMRRPTPRGRSGLRHGLAQRDQFLGKRRMDA